MAHGSHGLSPRPFADPPLPLAATPPCARGIDLRCIHGEPRDGPTTVLKGARRVPGWHGTMSGMFYCSGALQQQQLCRNVLTVQGPETCSARPYHYSAHRARLEMHGRSNRTTAPTALPQCTARGLRNVAHDRMSAPLRLDMRQYRMESATSVTAPKMNLQGGGGRGGG
jgi:hypothetical protein